MTRNHTSFLGVDLGGSRGKTTAVARLTRGEGGAIVITVKTKRPDQGPWNDEALLEYIGAADERSVLAVNAPLTQPACVRCEKLACPGIAACDVPAVVWLRTTGAALQEPAKSEAQVAGAQSVSYASTAAPLAKHPLLPYAHRATEVVMHFDRQLLPRDSLGRGHGAIAARAVHLRKQLFSRGWRLNQNLLEISARATVHALFGPAWAKGYKRDADPWETRAAIVESLAPELQFAPSSCLSREDVLQNDHCFDALLAAFTGYLWARDGWQLPPDAVADDGWIWTPPR